MDQVPKTPEAIKSESAPGTGFTTLMGDLGSLSSFSPSGAFKFNAEWQSNGDGDTALDLIIESNEKDQKDGRRPIPPALLSQALREAAEFVDLVRSMPNEHGAYIYDDDKKERFLLLKNRFTEPKKELPFPNPDYVHTNKCLYYDFCKSEFTGCASVVKQLCEGCKNRTGIWLEFAFDDNDTDEALRRPKKKLKTHFDHVPKRPVLTRQANYPTKELVHDLTSP